MTPTELYIISDLHLCDGSRVEDFRSDDERALVSFLFQLGRSRSALLIINGDFIDFVQIQPRSQMWLDAKLDATEADSLEKLDAAFRAHGPVFDALSRFVAAGHRLRFQPGNHDIDLVWPQVQARIRERLGQKHVHNSITFGHAWHDQGLYVAHGHQSDPVNSFANGQDVLHPDPQGVLRLERPWGTRLVEEFYNKIEVLDGCDMLDNVRPRMQAAVIIIKHAILQRHMHATLHAGVQVVVDTLAQLNTEEDVTNAAEQLGVSRQVLSWIASVAGWLGVRGRPQYTPKGLGALPRFAPSLQTAYTYGANLRDGGQLAELAPVVDKDQPADRLAPKSADDREPEPLEYSALGSRRLLGYAASLAAQHPDLRAICFGHTHLAITPALAVDRLPGWPIAASTARFFNSGSWTRTLDLAQAKGDAVVFEYLVDPRHYRLGRDYLKVTWPDGPGSPVVETLAWR